MMIEPSPASDTLYDRIMRLKPDGLSTRAWTINAGVGSSFFDNLAAGGKPREGELPKILAVVGITLAEFEGRRRPSPGAPAVTLPTLRVMPRAAKAPAEAAAAESAESVAAAPDAGTPAEEDGPDQAVASFAASTAEAVERWLEARRQAEAAGLETGGSEGIQLVTGLAGLALEIERAR